MLTESLFLDFKSSQIAAASLLLAVKMSFYADLTQKSGNRKDKPSRQYSQPLEMWDIDIEELTGLQRDDDVEPVYTILLDIVL